MLNTFVTYTGFANYQSQVDHTQRQVLNLAVYLPLEEDNFTRHSFLFAFCVFTYHVEISAVRLERLLDVGSNHMETLL